MAKRFTDTEKWHRPWFRALPPKAKCLWFYVLDNCDQAGVFHFDHAIASIMIGQKVNKTDLLHLKEQIFSLGETKYLIKDFISFQCGKLSETCNAHKPVIKKVNHHNLGKVFLTHIPKLIEEKNQIDENILGTLSNSLSGSLPVRLQEIEIEIEEETEIEIEKEKEKKKGKFDFDFVYSLYPKKEGKKKGIEKLHGAIKNQADYDKLILCTKNYVEKCKLENTELKYIKQFSTFANCYEDYCEIQIVNNTKPNSAQAIQDRMLAIRNQFEQEKQGENHAHGKY